MRKLLLVTCILALCLTACAAPDVQTRETVRIAMPAPVGLTDADSNYYKQWLEAESGYAIELELIPAGYMAEYLRLLFAGNAITVDAIFFDPESTAVSLRTINHWGEDGQLLALDAMLAREESNIHALFGSFTQYDLRRALLSEDGHIYAMPNLRYSNVLKSAQTMWINTEWLKETGMSIPHTTEGFRDVLRAFSANDPNGNGAQDELPLAFCTGTQAQNVVNYLMNAFVYCDPASAYMAMEKGKVFFAPATEQWRQGLSYCRELYAEGLLPEACFAFSEAQVVRAVTDPRDLVGAFTSESIDDVLSKNSPELYSKYMYVPPLEGPEGHRVATVKSFAPKAGGVITAACENPEAVFAVMDAMLSEEAYLIASFGEEGVDWDFAQANEISLSGSAATITVKSREWDIPTNKHFSGIGPFITYPVYGDGIAWNGYQGDQRYLNARAARMYQGYEPEEHISFVFIPAELNQAKAGIEAFVRDAMLAFIAGDKDPLDDKAWADYLQALDGLELDVLLHAAQASYIEYRKD